MLGYIGQELSQEEIAQFLHTTPGALEALDEEVRRNDLGPAWLDSRDEEDTLWEDGDVCGDGKAACEEPEIADAELIDRIVSELMRDLPVWRYGTQLTSRTPWPEGPERPPVTRQEIEALPEKIRPQLTGKLMCREVPILSYPYLLQDWAQILSLEEEPSAREERARAYRHFRRGLEILDLDPVTYRMIDRDPRSMGYWLPALAAAVDKGDTLFQIPETVLIKVPLPVLQLTRSLPNDLTTTTRAIVNWFCCRAFDLNESERWVVRTGTGMGTGGRGAALLSTPQDILMAGEHLLWMHGKTMYPGTVRTGLVSYGPSATTEWAARKFIPAQDGTPVPEDGLPQRPEIRLFLDPAERKVLGLCNRTSLHKDGTMSDGLTAISNARHGGPGPAGGLAQVQGARNYEIRALQNAEILLEQLHLPGQWSLDVMYDPGTDSFWLLDMAPAEVSEGYEACVPAQERRPLPEQWLPDLSAPYVPFTATHDLG